MTLYELMKITQEDYDTYDTVYDAEVTACYIEEKKNNDNYEKFCIGIIKKVEVEKGNGNGGLIVKWTELITNNMEKFRAFTKEHWREDCQYENDDEEFIYQWIVEIHNYMTGNVSEDFYETLVEFVEELEVGKEKSFSYEVIIGKDIVTAEEYLNGNKRKTPLLVGTANSYDIAMACRKIAFELLTRADGVQHMEEFFHETDIQEQISLMLSENKFSLEGDLID